MKNNTVMSVVTGCIAGMLLTGCDLFEYHPYSINISGKTNIHAENIPKIEQKCKGRSVIRFAFVTDTQSAVDELKDAIADIKKRGNIDFIVHGGDQTDFGLPKEYVWCRDLMERSNLPYVTVIGNHDCLGNGEHIFKYMYGNPNFSFNAGFVHFICLNTIALEYDYSNPVPDLNYMESDKDNTLALNVKGDSITHTIAVMHSRPGDEQFNNNLSHVFNYYLEQFPGANAKTDKNIATSNNGNNNGNSNVEQMKHAFCINGHNHHDEISDIFGNGMTYYGCTNMEDRVYYIFTITKEGHDYERVAY